ncbi:winged helix DNA-binding domain-containing protein [Ktedonosporobacter rubrisoli]|uniref:Winged helix DNA-binding domain-containing protein n=1 Tax=Ktedonosporobacter rubrisoli TaxID=2509675 RepID=A0A4P6JYE3_KTERU|nr:winged helix DNA-binding domain-containing protein [Ktedonosporobacter rubrisoli]QBD80819.1 winged helix DNA-binding domain-containing protein [Ktedonosporobacter rubrisoli]
MMQSTTGELSLSWSQVAARRLVRHGLDTPAQGARPAEIVRALCGAHAQVVSAAFWSIGLRSASLTSTAVKDALWSEHSLIKTFGPRGTVHLLAAQDLPLWAGALSALPPSHNGQSQEVRLTPEQTDEVVKVIAAALSDTELTIDELSEAVIAATGSWAGELVMPAFNGMWPRWRMALAQAGICGALCFGPNRGSKVTYTNPRRFLPEFAPVEERRALTWLLKSYLSAYGPATPQHFAQWLNAPRSWAKELFNALSAELEPVKVNGSLAWVVAGDSTFPSSLPQSVRLLPYFDAYAVGGQPRELLFPGRATQRALTPSGQAGNYQVLLVDGIVAGVWHQRRSGRRLDITVEAFEQLSATQRRELDEQVERIGAFLNAQPCLTLGPVNVGAHA